MCVCVLVCGCIANARVVDGVCWCVIVCGGVCDCVWLCVIVCECV